MMRPREYSRHLGPLVNVARVLFQKHGKLLKWNSEPESIMDLGIGDGRITKEVILPIIPENVREYIGVDISEPMLQVAGETIQHEKFKTIQFDITTKYIPSEMKNRFHHIISNFVFHHVPNINRKMFQPREFSKNLEPMVNIVRVLFQKHAKLLRWSSEPESIMDLGIGDGRMTKEVILPIVPKNIIEYIGADVSEPMLKSANETIQHEKFKTIQIDITTSNIPDELKNRFNHIIANNVFHIFPNIRNALVNIQYMLKPGGQLFFNTLSKSYLEEAYEILDRGQWKIYNNYKAHSPFYTSENPFKEYETLIKSLGYVDCHYFLEHFKLPLPEETFDELLTSINTRLPYVKEEDKEAYIRDFLNGVKQGKMVKQVVDEHTGKKLYEAAANFITGIISKPI